MFAIRFSDNKPWTPLSCKRSVHRYIKSKAGCPLTKLCNHIRNRLFGEHAVERTPGRANPALPDGQLTAGFRVMTQLTDCCFGPTSRFGKNTQSATVTYGLRSPVT